MLHSDVDYIDVLNNLKNDNVLSSTRIAFLMIDCALKLFENQRLKDIILDIISHQSSMAIVVNTGFKIIEAIDKKSLEELKSIKIYLESQSQKAIYDAAKRLSGYENIATISYSKTVYDTILSIKPKNVYLSIAHPAKEGEILACKLKENGIESILFEDSAYSLIMKNVDTVLVGADAIFDDSFVNKIGTLALALLAREFQVPFYVVSCKCKYLDRDKRTLFKVEDAPKREISESDCNIINRYFEEIPMTLVNKMFLGG